MLCMFNQYVWTLHDFTIPAWLNECFVFHTASSESTDSTGFDSVFIAYFWTSIMIMMIDESCV